VSVIQKEFAVYICSFDQEKYVPFRLPGWFVNADRKYKKIIRILGATAGIQCQETDIQQPTYEIPLAAGSRLYSNVSNDTPLNGFVMMVNNYNSIKEFDVTYSNLTELTWDIEQWTGKSIVDGKTNLIVEMELMITDKDYS
jgi:hypothetical protein